MVDKLAESYRKLTATGAVVLDGKTGLPAGLRERSEVTGEVDAFRLRRVVVERAEDE